MKMLSEQLIEITGMDAITLQPAAGAHGEFTGILLVRAYLESQGNPRKKILVPDSAHGTNPATAAMCGYAVENLKSNAAGMVDMASLEAQVNEDVAALMLTNPNTLGVFEQEIHKIADVLHAKGALLYMDGANMNALVGKVRPGDFGADVMHLNLHKTFSTPARRRRSGLRASGLQEDSGALSADAGGRQEAPTARWASSTTARNPSAACACSSATSECLCARWPTSWPTVPTACARPPKTRCSTPTTFARSWKAFTSCRTRRQPCTRSSSATTCRRSKGVKTGDIAKRLIDYGFHPYTVSFPLVVPGALMIEPTESESKEELDQFIDAMKSGGRRGRELARDRAAAPHNTRVSRMDETAAARKPVLRWKPAQ